MENINNAAAIINEWNSLTTQTQINFITACTFKIIKAQLTGTRYEINERRAAKGKVSITLAGIVYNAARASIAAISYSEKKHAAASVRTVKSEDGKEADYIDTVIVSKDNTEAAAILNVDLQRFIASRDNTDQQIIYGLMEKQTERELAAVVGISAPAVHKRIARIRAALAEII